MPTVNKIASYRTNTQFDGPVESSRDKGTGAFSVESPPEAAFRLLKIYGHFGGVVSTDVIITLKSRFDTDFDTVLKTIELSVTPGTDFYFIADAGDIYQQGDTIKVSGDASAETFAIVIERLLLQAKLK